MKLSFERTGGFGGMALSIELELDLLPQPDAQILRSMIDQADLFNLPANLNENMHVDGFVYSLSLELDDGEHCSIQLNDRSIPEKLQPLVTDLSLRARLQRRPG